MHWAVIDACLNNRVPFFWRGPGTLLISRSGIESVLKTITDAGNRVLGLEAFELDPTIHPRLDLIFDSDLQADARSALSVVTDWPNDIWIDVTLEPVSAAEQD